MPIIEIHGKQVHVEEGSESAKFAAEYLKKTPDNANAFFEMAHHDHTNGVAHFELPHTGENSALSHHFTLTHNGDGTYGLRTRTGF